MTRRDAATLAFPCRQPHLDAHGSAMWGFFGPKLMKSSRNRWFFEVFDSEFGASYAQTALKNAKARSAKVTKHWSSLQPQASSLQVLWVSWVITTWWLIPLTK